MKLHRLILLAVIFCAAEICQAAADNDFFTQGIELNRAGQFSEAVKAFENSVKKQPASGTLVNLGITEWQRGHAGAAILAWEQALWIDPFDSRANENLKFARAVAQLDEPQLKWFETASTWLPANAWAWLAGTGLWLVAGMMTLPGFFRWRKTGWHQALTALGFCIFLFSMTANLGVMSRAQMGFVLKKNAALLLTPTQTGEVISTLNTGEPARRLRTSGNYLFIRTEYGTGWVDRKQFGLVDSE